MKYSFYYFCINNGLSYVTSFSIIKSFGNKSLQKYAVANGLPIISFDIECGPREIIEDGKNGFLVAPFDENKFIEWEIIIPCI